MKISVGKYKGLRMRKQKAVSAPHATEVHTIITQVCDFGTGICICMKMLAESSVVFREKDKLNVVN